MDTLTTSNIDNIGWGRWFKTVAYQTRNDKKVIQYLELFDNFWLKNKYQYIYHYNEDKPLIDKLYKEIMNNSNYSNTEKHLIKLTYDYFFVDMLIKLNISKYDLL